MELRWKTSLRSQLAIGYSHEFNRHGYKAISRNIYTTLTGLAVRLLRCAKGHLCPAMLALARLADERQSFAVGIIIPGNSLRG